MENSLKRKADESENESEIRPIGLREADVASQPSQLDTSQPEADRQNPISVLANDAPPPSAPSSKTGHSNSRYRRRRRLRAAFPTVGGTMSTLGTLGLGAALMWYGLSEMSV